MQCRTDVLQQTLMDSCTTVNKHTSKSQELPVVAVNRRVSMCKLSFTGDLNRVLLYDLQLCLRARELITKRELVELEEGLKVFMAGATALIAYKDKIDEWLSLL